MTAALTAKPSLQLTVGFFWVVSPCLAHGHFLFLSLHGLVPRDYLLNSFSCGTPIAELGTLYHGLILVGPVLLARFQTNYPCENSVSKCSHILKPWMFSSRKLGRARAQHAALPSLLCLTLPTFLYLEQGELVSACKPLQRLMWVSWLAAGLAFWLFGLWHKGHIFRKAFPNLLLILYFILYIF